MIQINGTIELADNFGEDAIEAAIEMVKASRAEDGCLDYTMARDISDARVLILFERWRDRAALDAHIASPHMAEFQKVIAAHPPRKQDIRLYETGEGEPLG